MDDTKLIIVDNFQEYIDEMKSCAAKAGVKDVFICDDVESLKKEIQKTPLDILILISVSDAVSGFSDIVYLLENENVINTTIFVMDPKNKNGIELVDAHNGQWMDASRTYGEDTFNALTTIYNGIVAEEQKEYYLNEDKQNNQESNPNQNQPQPHHESRPHKRDTRNDAYTIVMASPKGGTGKSTLAMEIAYCLARNKRRKVCLVDLNPSFDTLSATIDCVRREQNYSTVYNWIDELNLRCFNLMTKEEQQALIESEDKDFFPYFEKYNVHFTKEDMQQLLIKDKKMGDKNRRDTGLWVLPAISLPFDIEYVQQNYITKIIDMLKEVFDFIVIDTADNLAYITVEGYKEADKIYLVTSHSTASAAVVAKLTSNLEQLDMSEDDFRLIVNSPNGNFFEKNPKLFSKALHIGLCANLPFEVGIQKAHAKGRPFSIYNPRSKFAKALEPVVEEIEDDAIEKREGGDY